jgi:hypothetical protein
MQNEQIIKEIKGQVERYREYLEVFSYAYRHTRFDKETEFMEVIIDYMDDAMNHVSKSLYKLFLRDNNLLEHEHKAIYEIRYTDDMIEDITNEYTAVTLDLPREWLDYIIEAYFSDELKITDNNELEIIFEF